jgi:HSP20 family molecular chaperone IbpA
MSEKKSQTPSKGAAKNTTSAKSEVMAPADPQTEISSHDSEQRSLFVRPVYHSARVDDEWEVAVVMPGVKRKDVSVSLEQSELTVFGRRSDSVPAGWRPLYEERHKADYRLRLQLNFDADPEGISANLEDGVLKVRLPEHAAAKPRQIEVK